MVNPDPQFCPQCGHPLPPGVNLTGQQRKIYDAVQKKPRSVHDLFHILYGHYSSGGPDSVKIIHVYVAQINQRLKPFGVRLYSIGRKYYLMGDQ